LWVLACALSHCPEFVMNITANEAKLARQFPKALEALVQKYDVESANALDSIKARLHDAGENRYCHKFVNGVHVVFDRRFYCNAEVFPTLKAVEAALR
jgi:hypothetical protein